MLVAGLDVGGSSVKAWVRDLGAGRTWQVQRPLATQRPAPHRAELDPAAWERACRAALADVVEQAGRPGGDYLGVTVSSLRQGFVLLDGADTAIGGFFRGVDLADPAKAAAKLKVGTRVKTRFADERKGDVLDFWFELESVEQASVGWE